VNEERVATLKKLLEMDPEDTFTRYALGLEHLTEDPRQAQAIFREVVERQHDYVAAWFQLGKVSADLGETDAARQAYETGQGHAARQQDWHAHGELQEALDEL
jgi:Tfp pilus assembly protein PilF